jgi:uncharacterized damage-inducible protein DinB
MIPAIRAYFEKLSGLHEGFKREINSLPTAALDWSPGEGMNSIAVLTAHTAGAARFIIGEVVGGQPAGRDRDAEFQARNLDGAAFSAYLDDALAQHEQVLAALQLVDLEAIRFSTRHNREVSVMWALAHALDHTATHLGHAQITRQLWERRAA